MSKDVKSGPIGERIKWLTENLTMEDLALLVIAKEDEIHEALQEKSNQAAALKMEKDDYATLERAHAEALECNVRLLRALKIVRMAVEEFEDYTHGSRGV